VARMMARTIMDDGMGMVIHDRIMPLSMEQRELGNFRCPSRGLSDERGGLDRE
jgi:hypothetical protein